MPFEKGNKLAQKPRLFDQALRRAIAQNDGEKVRQCVDKLLDLAADGEAWAVRELADRLDGKAAQSITLTDSSNVQEMTQAEILERLAAIRRGTADGASEAQASATEPPSVH